jgi:5,10-methylenetetrahydrofolate reductase
MPAVRESALVRAIRSSLDSAPRVPLVVTAELRPPRAELGTAAGIDAWIDTYHAVKSLVRRDRYVFLTDSAVGLREEDNLRHLMINLGADVPRSHVVPFLTCKHPLDYCLNYADRAWEAGFDTLVILGGDRHVGPPRCVEHAWELRRHIRARVPELALGGWANPHADAARQVDYILEEEFTAEFYLTQIVSHHDRPAIDAFMNEAARRGVETPGIFGVFYYRSANPKTLNTLREFLPVPVDGLTREFAEGATPEQVCARSIRALADAGAKAVYVSNLPVGRAQSTLANIMEQVNG